MRELLAASANTSRSHGGVIVVRAGCMLLLPCIYNLLQRHPTCKCMIHRERKRVLDGSVGSDHSQSTMTDGVSDPFVEETDDPACANALGSSLWELEALKRHSYPPVAKFVKVFSADFTKPVSSKLGCLVPVWPCCLPRH